MNELLKDVSVVPVVVIDDASKAVPVAQALVAGGLSVIEVTMRTAAAIEAVKAMSSEVPEAVVGAGTVLNSEQAHKIVAAGARFIVSPGLSEDVVAAARDLSVPIIPGIATATEAQRAWNLGLRAVKFFPAEQAGGIGMLRALAAVFGDLRFMPTGGVTPGNVREYLEMPAVLACGGSWLTPANAMAKSDYGQITDLATEAVALVNDARS